MLRLINIHTFYGQIEALKGIDIEVRKGEIVALIGSNGAGKSTTLMTVSGVLKPRVGDVFLNDRKISGLKAHHIVRSGIGHVPEGRRIFPWLTVRENLEMGAYSRTSGLRFSGSSFMRQIEKIYELFPVLKERERQSAGTLSGGEQQMLAIGRALMSEPQILLLDEPSLGLSPIMVSKIFKIIKEINEDGVTILLVEQNAQAALSLSERAYVLENGKITITGKGKELLSNEVIRKAYLGG
ncbi:MAG: ABC transporter ATP-binding protein [Thermodesulfovibrionales bacterium]